MGRLIQWTHKKQHLDFNAKVVNSENMKLLAETLEAKTKGICEKLLERSLDDEDWTRMKLPTSLGGMGIRAVTSQLETSFDIAMKKTRKQAERIEKSLAGKERDCTSWKFERERDTKCGTELKKLDTKTGERQ